MKLLPAPTDPPKEGDIRPSSNTKWVKCDCDSCGERGEGRGEPTEPTTLKGAVIFEAPLGHPGPYFCSGECYGIWLIEEQQKQRERGRRGNGRGTTAPSSTLCPCGHDVLWEHRHEEKKRTCLVWGCQCVVEFAA